MASDVVTQTKISTGFLTVVPKQVRRLVGANEGDLVEWTLRGAEITVRIRKPKTVKDIVGIIAAGGDAVASKRAVQGLQSRVR